MKITNLLLIIFFCISLAACGGGGGGGAGSATVVPITATVNTTAQILTIGAAMSSFSPLTASNGTKPYSYSYTGTLPTGLSFSTSTGAMTGTPTATYATASLVFSVQDANNVVASSTSTVSFSVVPEAVTHPINDTGITSSDCYQTGSNILVNCGSAGAISLNNAQDGMIGRDSDAATNSNADGHLGFSFSSMTGGCVQDNISGLMWEIKTTDGGLRDWNKAYSNYDSASDLQKWDGITYVAPTQTEIDASTNSVGFKNSVNVQGLCGYSDWRIPTVDELQSIVNINAQPTIDVTWFPNTQNTLFWTASPFVGAPSDAWIVSFGSGFAYYIRDNGYPVRLVRGGQSPTTPHYIVSANGQEVTDNQTKLIWRRCAEGMNWDGSTCVGAALTLTNEAALQLATTQASSTGIAWRLPNINELSSIANKNLSNPAIDRTAFPATPLGFPGNNGWFWSSTPTVIFPTYAWVVVFNYGYITYTYRTYIGYVRLVRDAL